MWSRLQGNKTRFGFSTFSLLDILPKYMNPKIVLRTLYALDDLPKIADGRVRGRGRGRVRTDIDF